MKKITLPIKEVTVLTDGALITRQKKVKLVKGEQTLTVTELSEFLDEDSIKVRGTGKVKLVDISPVLQHIYRDEENLIEIEKEILKTEKEIEQRNLRLESLKVSINALTTTIKSIAEGFGRYGMIKNKTVDDFREYYSFYQSQIEVENAKKIQLEHEIIELNKLLNSLKEKKNQMQYLENEFYEINIILDAQEDCEIELELSYTVSQASWTPVYMIELTKGEALIQRLAKVYNRTRIDWNKTKVTISTANRRPISIEEVDPLYLYLYEPVYPVSASRVKKQDYGVKRAMRPKAMAIAEKELMKPAPAPVPEAELDDLYVETAKSTSVVGHQRFELSGKHDIPSGKTPKTLYLDSFKVKVEKQYYWSSLDEKLILTHKLKNEDQFLLEGEAKVFIDGEFISQSHLDLIHPKDEFTVGLIESYDLKIERKLLKREVAKAGITKGKEQIDFHYQIKIKNQIEEKAELKVIERIPYPQDPNIEVITKEISPEPRKQNQGVLEWKISIEPGKEEKINISYIVKYPKGEILEP
ncbi:MAG: mucoidy inhibitor MuiA family protein, partial [Candidatus Heimdallarchaeaceae archaeon]